MNLRMIQPPDCPEDNGLPNFDQITDQEFAQYMENVRWLNTLRPERLKVIAMMIADAEFMLEEGYSNAEIVQYLSHYFGEV